MPKANSTLITIVLDRSGSMRAIRKDMEGGFDAFIADQRRVPGACSVTLAQFDDTYDVVYTDRPLDSVPPLSIEPRGMTALLDAVGRTIDATGARLAAMPEADRPEKVLVMVITDGCENASQEYTRERIKEMITHQSEKYSWEFLFLGANQDSITVAGSIGISSGNAVTFDANSVGTSGLMRGVSKALCNYRTNGSPRGAIYGQADYQASVAQP